MKSNSKNQKLWRKRVNDFNNSEMTMRAWCETNQVKIHQLQYWKKKFKTIEKVESTRLVKVELTETSHDLSHETPINIHVGTVILEVKPGFSPSLLREIMKVLMTC